MRSDNFDEDDDDLRGIVARRSGAKAPPKSARPTFTRQQYDSDSESDGKEEKVEVIRQVNKAVHRGSSTEFNSRSKTSGDNEVQKSPVRSFVPKSKNVDEFKATGNWKSANTTRYEVEAELTEKNLEKLNLEYDRKVQQKNAGHYPKEYSEEQQYATRSPPRLPKAAEEEPRWDNLKEYDEHERVQRSYDANSSPSRVIKLGNNTSSNEVSAKTRSEMVDDDGEREFYEKYAKDGLRSNSSNANSKSKTFDALTGVSGSVPGAPPISFVFISPPHGIRPSDPMMRCLIVRNNEGYNPLNMTKFFPSYELILQGQNQLILIAKKMKMNRTSNYHLFDMTRGNLSSNLTKKSGNYIGKLRAVNYNRSEYVLVTANSETREQIAAVMFEHLGVYEQIMEGTQPRKLSAVVPLLDNNSQPIPYAAQKHEESAQRMGKVPKDREHSLLDFYNTHESDMISLKSKDPVLEKGNYRLNFGGRVTVPSVKNFQLVPVDDINNIVCQFGKVGAQQFHLDYKAPLNAVQAFAMALCQFNI